MDAPSVNATAAKLTFLSYPGIPRVRVWRGVNGVLFAT
jgi:hypothetical protein